MGVLADIAESYRAPRRVMRRLLAGGPDEGRALAYLLAASFLLFIAQWPQAVRAAYFAPEVPLEARIGGILLASLFMFPLLAYLLAALSQLVLRVIGGAGSFWAARMALFWALLAAAPLQLLNGLYLGFADASPFRPLPGLAAFLAFVAIWVAGLRVAAFEKGAPDAI